MPTILAIDDEPAILHAFRRVFDEPGMTLITAQSAIEGLRCLREHSPDVVILDINLPDVSGLKVYEQINQHDAHVPVVFITGHGTTDTAIQAIKNGALDYLFKPLDIRKLREAVSTAFEVRQYMQAGVTGDVGPEKMAEDDLLVGRCEAMNLVYKFIGRVAAQDVSVLITGASGTGKELVARSIWRHSRRANRPFTAVNCAAIPESLIESEFFGHEKGAFTGADRRHIGKFEECAGGTLFLDEISEMTPSAQAKLLRVLQEKVLTRVGGHEIIPADVRIIAASNHAESDLANGVHCRRDLYYRISVSSVYLPPLRERGQDIQLLTDHYIERFGEELGRPAMSINDEARDLLQQYPWPGNVRELQSAIKQALLHTVGSTLIPDFLPTTIRHYGSQAYSASTRADTSNADFNLNDWDSFIARQLQSNASEIHANAMAIVEKHLINRVMAHTQNSQRQAASILGISRSTLRTKMKIYDIK